MSHFEAVLHVFTISKIKTESFKNEIFFILQILLTPEMSQIQALSKRVMRSFALFVSPGLESLVMNDERW